MAVRKGRDRAKAEAELARLSEEKTRDLKDSKVIQCRVRYFTDGAMIGSRKFADGVLQASRKGLVRSGKRLTPSSIFDFDWLISFFLL